MKLIIAKIGKNKTVGYAFSELYRCLRAMDSRLFIEGREYDTYDASKTGILWLGLDGSTEKSELDEISISINNGAGIITGSSERAVLIAAYRFLHELGCRWLFPGNDGEIIPKKTFTKEMLSVSLHERASSRHRGVCIEGSVGYEHVKNMIEWLPRVGMNAYFMQFQTPSYFFKRFYNAKNNPFFENADVNDDDISRIWSMLEEDIELRGLDYHATGHGWTCKPFGFESAGWGKFEGELSPEFSKYLAKVNGKREFWHDIPLNTNLCYSNSEVGYKMNASIVQYCKEHPSVNFLHFWLADDNNNHCECEECSKMPPSDFYVRILNDLDRRLSAEGMTTKIVCLIYVDLLWEPQYEKIENPDRFVLMFAPISRTYSKSFADVDLEKEVELSPYVRNKLVMPSSVEENLARLRSWQEDQLSGDSFDFDYHLMWDHYFDPGYYECARILHSDMANLGKIGLRGMISCQTQRASLPTGLPMYAMAKALWNKDSTFEEVSRDYFTSAFGEYADKVENYLSTLSTLFNAPYLRAELPSDPEGMRENCLKAKATVESFTNEYIIPHKDDNASWNKLYYHSSICLLYADTIIEYLCGDEEDRTHAKDKLNAHVNKMLPYIHESFDENTFNIGIELRLSKIIPEQKNN